MCIYIRPASVLEHGAFYLSLPLGRALQAFSVALVMFESFGSSWSFANTAASKPFRAQEVSYCVRKAGHRFLKPPATKPTVYGICQAWLPINAMKRI
jgi:hypothetical protein